MLGETIQYIRTLPQDAVQRADAFEALAGQIAKQSHGLWSASRGRGTDGSHIFLGRQGEGLIVGPDGRLYRGTLGHGIVITPNGLCPDYNTLMFLG